MGCETMGGSVWRTSQPNTSLEVNIDPTRPIRKDVHNGIQHSRRSPALQRIPSSAGIRSIPTCVSEERLTTRERGRVPPGLNSALGNTVPRSRPLIRDRRARQRSRNASTRCRVVIISSHHNPWYPIPRISRTRHVYSLILAKISESLNKKYSWSGRRLAWVWRLAASKTVRGVGRICRAGVPSDIRIGGATR